MFARGRIPTSTDFFEHDRDRGGSRRSTRCSAGSSARREQARRCLWILLVEREPPRGARDPRLARHLASRAGSGRRAQSDGAVGRPGRRDAQLGDRGRRLPLVQPRRSCSSGCSAAGSRGCSSPAIARAHRPRHPRHRPVLGLDRGCSSWWSSSPAAERQMARLLNVARPGRPCSAAVVAGPVVSQRLAGFGGPQGLPPSWLGRFDNLTHFYLPELARLPLGARRPARHRDPGTGDLARRHLPRERLPLALLGGRDPAGARASSGSCGAGFRHTKQVVIARRTDDIGVAAVAARAALWCLVILSSSTRTSRCAAAATCSSACSGSSANLNVPEPVPEPEPPRAARSAASSADRRELHRREPRPHSEHAMTRPPRRRHRVADHASAPSTSSITVPLLVLLSPLLAGDRGRDQARRAAGRCCSARRAIGLDERAVHDVEVPLDGRARAVRRQRAAPGVPRRARRASREPENESFKLARRPARHARRASCCARRASTRSRSSSTW